MEQLKKLPPLTRSNSACSCEICRIATAKFPNLGQNNIIPEGNKVGRPPLHPVSEKHMANPIKVRLFKRYK